MNYSELFATAISALRGNIMRTALTMLGIIIGIASVILIIALAQGATSTITSSVSSLGSNLLIVSPGEEKKGPAQGSENVTTLKYDDALAMKNLDGVAAVSAVVQSRFQIVGNGQNTNISVIGVSYQYPTIQSLDLDKGNFFKKEDEEGRSRVAVLGSEVAETLFGKEYDPTGEIITIGKKSFRVIGVNKSKGSSGFSNPDKMVYIPVTTAMKILIGRDYLSSVMAVTDDVNKVDAVNGDIKTLLTERHSIAEGQSADFNIRTSKEMQSTLSTVTTTLTMMLGSIAGVSLIVGGIGIMNIMMVTVTERTKEIGLLKAIGAKRKDILIQFLIESIVLTITGGIVGILLGEILAFVISTIVDIPYVFQINSILLAVGISTLVGIVFGIYPAQRGAKLSPIDALRYE